MVAAIATEILRALDHLHSSLKIVHGSVNEQNVVCSDLIPDKFQSTFKLVNIEGARFDGSKKPPTSKKADYLVFMPPEDSTPGTEKIVSKSTDIWQLGVLIMRLLSGNFAYIDSLQDPVAQKRVKNTSALEEAINSDVFSYSLRDFLSKCIV